MKKILLTLIFVLYLNATVLASIKHTVVKGETIESVAKKYGVTPDDIRKLNPVTKLVWSPGMVLVIPETKNDKKDKETPSKPRRVKDSRDNTRITPSQILGGFQSAKEKRTGERDNRTRGDLDSPLLKFGGYNRKSFSMYLALQGNIGFSNFHSPDVNCNGKFSYGGELQFQLYDKGGLLFDGYYLQAGIGYQSIGAADFDMNYIQIRLLPLGYAHNFDEEKSIVVKAGVYAGLPLNDLESSRYTFVSKKDFGLDLGVAFDYKLITIGATFQCSSGNISESDNELLNMGVFGSITYKFGQF